MISRAARDLITYNFRTRANRFVIEGVAIEEERETGIEEFKFHMIHRGCSASSKSFMLIIGILVN